MDPITAISSAPVTITAPVITTARVRNTAQGLLTTNEDAVVVTLSGARVADLFAASQTDPTDSAPQTFPLQPIPNVLLTPEPVESDPLNGFQSDTTANVETSVSVAQQSELTQEEINQESLLAGLSLEQAPVPSAVSLLALQSIPTQAVPPAAGTQIVERTGGRLVDPAPLPFPSAMSPVEQISSGSEFFQDHPQSDQTTTARPRLIPPARLETYRTTAGPSPFYANLYA